MEFFTSALAAIPQAAMSGLGAVLFVVTVTAWLVISWKVRRNANLLRRIKDVPEGDRANLIKVEMGGAYLQTGMSAEAFLQYQRQRNLLVGYLVSLVAAVVLLAFAVYLAYRQSPIEHPDAINIGIPVDTSLEDMVTLLERQKNVTVVFSPTCAADVRTAKIDAGNHEGKDPKEFLERLQSRTKSAVQYRVLSSGVANERLEINCR